MNEVQRFVQDFLSGRLSGNDTTNLIGRVIRGKSAKDFETLSDEPTRRLVLLTDSVGLASMVGKPAFHILESIGWEPDFAIRKIIDGYRIKLVVAREGGPVRLGTWDGMMHSVCLAYPEVSAKLVQWLPHLKRSTFGQLEAAYGCDLSEVDRLGQDHPRYMTLERYQAAEDNPANARAFLYFICHLREQYAGDGYTYDAQGVRGVREYFSPNCKLTELMDAEVIDLIR